MTDEERRRVNDAIARQIFRSADQNYAAFPGYDFGCFWGFSPDSTLHRWEGSAAEGPLTADELQARQSVAGILLDHGPAVEHYITDHPPILTLVLPMGDGIGIEMRSVAHAQAFVNALGQDGLLTG